MCSVNHKKPSVKSCEASVKTFPINQSEEFLSIFQQLIFKYPVSQPRVSFLFGIESWNFENVWHRVWTWAEKQG